MTATTNSSEAKRSQSEAKQVRISYMEILGFSDSTTVWSDNPLPAPPKLGVSQRGRHEATEVEPDPMEGWTPTEVGSQLNRSNFRWSRLVIAILLAAITSVGAYLWYLNNQSSGERANAGVTDTAAQLNDSLEGFAALNIQLTAAEIPPNTDAIVDLDTAARSLFDAISEVNQSQSTVRVTASEAAGTALDAGKTLSDAIAYRRAVTPILVAPELETDPDLIELDEAARLFGEWQIGFDSVRTALPEGQFEDVTQALDILSGDLSIILADYVDALREDDEDAARAQLGGISDRFHEIETTLDSTLENIQARVDERIAETRSSLESLLG